MMNIRTRYLAWIDHNKLTFISSSLLLFLFQTYDRFKIQNTYHQDL